MKCSVELCEKETQARGYCGTHYMRVRRTGNTDDPVKSIRLCSIAGCDRVHDSRGLCKYHYKHLRRSEGVGRFCIVEDCDRPHEAQGLCNLHYGRFRDTGSVELILRLGELSPKWQGSDIKYEAAHRRLEAARGSVSDYLCIYCACPAQQWSYDHADPNELIDPRGRPYSPDINHYEPMCRKCHRHEDVRAARKQLTA